MSDIDHLINAPAGVGKLPWNQPAAGSIGLQALGLNDPMSPLSRLTAALFAGSEAGHTRSMSMTTPGAPAGVMPQAATPMLPLDPLQLVAPKSSTQGLADMADQYNDAQAARKRRGQDPWRPFSFGGFGGAGAEPAFSAGSADASAGGTFNSGPW